MSNIARLSKYITLWAAAILTSACSISNDSGLAGIEGTGDREGDGIAAKGSVTKFGSIYVNGIHFNTDRTQFIVDGSEVDEETIKQGMVVYVEGTPGSINSEATATLVTFDYLLKGKIESIINNSSNERIISLLGHTISTSEDAAIGGGTFDQLSEGDYISVSGFSDGESHIKATRIDITSPTEEVVIFGVVSAVSAEHSTFNIFNQSIEYSTATFRDGSSENIAIGSNIKVHGTIDSNTQAIQATEIHFIQQAPVKHSRATSAEGFISDFSSLSNFTLNNTKVDASKAEIMGDDASRLGNGTRITMTGATSEDKVFNASSLYIHQQSVTRVSGSVTNINNESGSFTISGFEFFIDTFTNFEDIGPLHNRYFSLDDISIGDQLDIFTKIFDKQNIAVTIRRKSDSYHTGLRIKGRISSFSAEDQFLLMGVLVDASAIPQETRDLLDLDTTIIVSGDYNSDSTFVADDIFILLSKCTSHREDDCKKQWSDDRKDEGGPQKKDSPFDVNVG